MNTKKELDEDWADTMQTLESLRSVIVKQRIKWHKMIGEVKKESCDNIVATTSIQLESEWQKKFFDYIVKLHKDSEVLEHMINRIENGMNKSRCTITLGEESE